MLTRPILSSVAVLFSIFPLIAVEPWSDSRLALTQGLELWLDASAQPGAWKAHEKPPLLTDALMDVWFDGSGQQRHVLQHAQSSQPRFVSVDRVAVVRFDGSDDHFATWSAHLKINEFSAFIVAAPYSNAGGFRSFLAAAQIGLNDYRSGFTLDLGPGASPQFNILNAEGKGFGGAADVMKDSFPFRETHLIEMIVSGVEKEIRVFIDGKLSGQRQYIPSRLNLDEITVGSRLYSNSEVPPFISGFLDGHIAEILLFNRVLDGTEVRQVRDYLQTKYATLDSLLAGQSGGTGVVAVKDPPVVQMLVPGFSVRELPVTLKNINNVKYRPDGKLLALGYDGNVYLLSDTNGDGLEEKTELFWDNQSRLRAPIGMALTPTHYALGDGLFVASKGKLSLIVDTNHDDRADQEIVVASGWPELPHGVDALGVAFDARDGSVYFGLGTANFTDAYLIDKATGRSRYDLESERGTILKVSPDLKRREIVCTGIRFPVGMAFNNAGDLFCTDQEGATWLPNGNPLDELLHIQPGRHYGFPPRHPKHLPSVIDEPSVYDYGPQHQSTCGLDFNVAVNGGPVFGPAWWSGDAIVCGYARGKLYRTKLAKTPAGYVAQNQLLACLNVLTADACVSPAGDLVIATHSGQPDWGSGPTGLGKLYKISYTDQKQPQPVLVWAANAGEVRVAFDRPLLPEHFAGLAAKTTITHGEFVRAGDRFETVRPGYDAVRRQMATPRFSLPVTAASVTPDRRVLILMTEPHARADHYSVILPGIGDSTQGVPGSILSPHAEIELDYELAGVEVAWLSAGDLAGPSPSLPSSVSESAAGWLPHLDLAVARAFTSASVEHDRLWSQLRQPGRLRLRCQLNLRDMLRPALQPGSTIDYDWPAEQITLTFKSSNPLVVHTSADSPHATITPVSNRESVVRTNPQEQEWLPLEIELTTGGEPQLDVIWQSAEDPRPRALATQRILLPWVKAKPTMTKLTRKMIPELEGGSWARGRAVFFSDEALCSKCHAVGGEGSKIGPDLSNLIHRDYASVLRDIRDPSASLNPDFITYELALKNGETSIGTIQTGTGDKLRIGQGPGLETTLLRSEVKEMRPLATSMMPPGLDQALGPARLKDLLTYLLLSPPRMSDYGPGKPPAPRTRDEVESVLRGAPLAASGRRPIHLVLVAGRKDHGPGEHDYPEWQKAWTELLAVDDTLKVTTAWDWPTPEDIQSADGLLFFHQGRWTPERAGDLDRFLARGGGLSFLHYAVDGGTNAAGFAKRIGLAWSGGKSKFRHGELDLVFNRAVPEHPIVRNLERIRFFDESYWQLIGDPSDINLIASGVEEGAPQPLIWTREQGGGRVFVSILGHYSWTFDDPLFRLLLLRGIAWTVKEPVDRFNQMIWPGATVKE